MPMAYFQWQTVGLLKGTYEQTKLGGPSMVGRPQHVLPIVGMDQCIMHI